jgi:EcsC protein family
VRFISQIRRVRWNRPIDGKAKNRSKTALAQWVIHSNSGVSVAGRGIGRHLRPGILVIRDCVGVGPRNLRLDNKGRSTSVDKNDTDALRSAVQPLEHDSLTLRLANMIGKPVALFGRILPVSASQAVAAATTKSLEVAVKAALQTIGSGFRESSEKFHRALVVTSGAAGGALGIYSLPLELPVSTVIILRSILDIARSEGENLADPESSLSCVQVFGLGGRTETDGAADGGYFVLRGIFATSVTEAARFIAERGLVEEGSPALVRLITQIASRFGCVVSQKVAAQAIPAIGALGGAVIN